MKKKKILQVCGKNLNWKLISCRSVFAQRTLRRKHTSCRHVQAHVVREVSCSRSLTSSRYTAPFIALSDHGTAYSADFEGCRTVTLDPNQRLMDARAYSVPFDIAQILENTYAVFDCFNATRCTISILHNVENFVRPMDPPGKDGAVSCGHGLAVQVLDNGRGIYYKIVDQVMRYGYRGLLEVTKKLGAICNCRILAASNTYFAHVINKPHLQVSTIMA